MSARSATLLVATLSDNPQKNWINAIAATGQTVWIGTYEGLHRYGVATGRMTHYDDPSGMARNPVTAMSVTPEEVWIAVRVVSGGASTPGLQVNAPAR